MYLTTLFWVSFSNMSSFTMFTGVLGNRNLLQNLNANIMNIGKACDPNTACTNCIISNIKNCKPKHFQHIQMSTEEFSIARTSDEPMLPARI